MASNNGANKGMRYTRWNEQKPDKPKETKEEKKIRLAKAYTAVKKHRAGRPKKYDNKEDRRVAHNERQRKVYRATSKTDRDLSTQAGKLGAWQDLIDAM